VEPSFNAPKSPVILALQTVLTMRVPETPPDFPWAGFSFWRVTLGFAFKERALGTSKEVPRHPATCRS